MKIKIHDYTRKVHNLLEKIENSGICPENRAKLLEFYREMLAQGLSQARISKYLYTLLEIASWTDMPFEELGREQIAELIRRIESSGWSDWTKHDYRLMLKIFYRWLRRADDYPPEVMWIKANQPKTTKLPEELLTEEEVARMAGAATNPRDRALVHVLYDSGCRIGELLSLQLKHVHFDEHGAQLIVSGKTGMRRVRIIESATKLRQWLEHHPDRGNPDAPLWTRLHRNSALSYGRASDVLEELGRKAGIKKRIYPHLFRHSRATALANHLTESQLKGHFGWTQASAMAGIYVHLSGKDVDDALLRLHGIEPNGHGASPQSPGKPHPPGKPRPPGNPPPPNEVRAKAERLAEILVSKPELLDALLERVERLSAARA
jgi:site-specific recombinase XerD